MTFHMLATVPDSPLTSFPVKAFVQVVHPDCYTDLC